MLRKVWLDYLEGFRWSKIRAFYNFNRAWIFIYMLTMLPFIVQNNHEEIVLVEYYLIVRTSIIIHFSPERLHRI